MKKIVFAALVMASPFVAAKDYGAAGCGLGSMLFNGQTGLGPHIFAATTNNFYGTQTFAMSSGTLGCDVSGDIQSHTALFIDQNMESIASNMVQGEGEALMALAEVMAIDSADRETFAKVLKDNFHLIYANDSVTSEDVVNALVIVMKSDKVLAKYVS